MERTEKINEIIDLLSGEQPMQEILILTETETPGIFKFRDKIVTEEEIIELQKGYLKTVRFVHHK
jgi:hypothetical protein